MTIVGGMRDTVALGIISEVANEEKRRKKITEENEKRRLKIREQQEMKNSRFM